MKDREMEVMGWIARGFLWGVAMPFALFIALLAWFIMVQFAIHMYPHAVEFVASMMGG